MRLKDGRNVNSYWETNKLPISFHKCKCIFSNDNGTTLGASRDAESEGSEVSFDEEDTASSETEEVNEEYDEDNNVLDEDVHDGM